ncbi:hypothetical protein LPJ59_004032, partial [Coemansia sp. RSA 2399]
CYFQSHMDERRTRHADTINNFLCVIRLSQPDNPSTAVTTKMKTQVLAGFSQITNLEA